MRTRRFDVIFVDIVPPRMTALIRTLEEVAKHDTGCSTVVYVTANGVVKRHVDMCVRLGASGVIDKSAPLEHVGALLREALQRSVANAPLETWETATEGRLRNR